MNSTRSRPGVKDYLEYAAFRAIVAAMHALPTDFAIRLMGRAWQIVAPRLSRHRRALRHIAAAMPDLPQAERERIVRSMWRHLGMTAAETMLIDRIWHDARRLSHADPQLSQEIIARGRGVLVTLHQGNWELTVAPVTLAGHEVAAVYQKIRNPLVERYVRHQRRQLYRGGLYAKGREAAVNLMRHAEHDFVGVVADLRDARKVTVPFFAMPAPSTPFPAMIAISRKLPIIAGRAVRTGPGRFRIEAEYVPVADSGDRQKDVEETTANIQAVFERWVRDIPEQWMWAHKRWAPQADKGSPDNG